MKGIILAGGTGSRMWPITSIVSKQLLPIYDKPMIYYPLCTLLLAGIREILIITQPNELELFKQLLGSGDQWGLEIKYAVQASPEGIPQAFVIGEKFIGQDNVCLVLGDNLIYGQGLQLMLSQAATQHTRGATIFAYRVHDPERYGVVEVNATGDVISLKEKPKRPASNLAVIGLYFYDNQVISIAKSLKQSARKEYEIMDINQYYQQKNELRVITMGRGMAWLDTGTPEALLEASQFIHIVEKRQGFRICCPEEIAWRLNYIDDEQLEKLAYKHPNSFYGKYLINLLPNKMAYEIV